MREFYEAHTAPPAKLTSAQIELAAEAIDVDYAALAAVIEVEARTAGFDSAGRLTMLYEPHIAYRYGGKHRAALVEAGVASAKAGTIKYPASANARYEQLHTCARIAGWEIACISTSWGLPQMMGFNAKSAGHANAVAMVEAFAKGEAEQIAGMSMFIVANPAMHRALKERHWANFARAYNGPAYHLNRYDERIAAAYYRINGNRVYTDEVIRFGDKGEEVRYLQRLLQNAGYDLVADGHFGKVTLACVEDYQDKKGLKVDGLVGPKTMGKLQNED